MKGIRNLGKGKHNHLKRNPHGKQAEIVQRGSHFMIRASHSLSHFRNGSFVSLNGKEPGDLAQAGMLQTSDQAVKIEGSTVTLPPCSIELMK
ncbi:MAG: hypothetical protein ACI4EG_10650 [Fusicatenibacter sp.]